MYLTPQRKGSQVPATSARREVEVEARLADTVGPPSNHLGRRLLPPSRSPLFDQAISPELELNPPTEKLIPT